MRDTWEGNALDTLRTNVDLDTRNVSRRTMVVCDTFNDSLRLLHVVVEEYRNILTTERLPTLGSTPTWAAPPAGMRHLQVD